MNSAATIARSGGDAGPGQPGAALVLAAGPMRAEIRPEAGGRIAALWREDPKGRRVDVLVPMPAGAFDPFRWPKAGLYPLVPFSNRIRDARLRAGGRDVRLPAQPGEAHAVHGFGQRKAWRAEAAKDAGIVLRLAHDPAADPDEGWPWAFTAWQRLALDASGLTQELAVTNRGAEPMPAGLGSHPFFAVAPGDRVQFSLDGMWDLDAAGFPTGLRALTGRERLYDRPHGTEGVTLFGAGFSGIASIQRRDGSRVVIETGAPLDHIVFHVPPGGGACCLEPVSHVADAFNLSEAGVAGTGARMLAPGETLRAIVRIGLA
ncbi:MAG: aldose 1-epimerase [Alsobacter sp.]